MKWFLGSTTTIIAVLFFAATFSMSARPTTQAQLLMMASVILLFPLSLAVPACISPAQRRYRVLLWLTPLLVPLLFVLATRIGGVQRTRLFYRDLPSLQQVVRLIATDTLPIHDGRVVVPQDISLVARMAFARREEDGTLQITFFVGGGFPVKHLAYLYRSDGAFPPKLAQDWPKRRQRQENWFEVSD